MDSDEIYKFIGYTVAVLFFIYIISKILRLNTRIIEAFGVDTNNPPPSTDTSGQFGNKSDGNKSDDNNKSNNNKDDNDSGDTKEERKWINDMQDKTADYKKANSETVRYLTKHKNTFLDLLNAYYTTLNVNYIDQMSIISYGNDWSKSGDATNAKNGLELIQLAIKNLSSGFNKK
jgi:hypothetical protein